MYSLLRYTQRLPLALPLLSIAFVSTSVSFVALAKKEQHSTLTSPLLYQQTATPWYQSTSISPSNMTITTTPPIQEGQLFFPAETAPHLATILGFPSPHAVPRELLRATRNEILDLAVTISEFEPVRVHVRAEDEELAREVLVKRHARLVDMYSVEDGKGKKKNKKKGKVDDGEIPQYNLNNVTFHTCPTNHPWVRDTAPVYVLDTTNPGKRVAIDFGFCEWGGKNHGEIDVRDELVLQEYKDARDERAPINRTGYEIPDKRHWENSRFAKQVLELEAHANNTNITTTDEMNQRIIERITSPVRLEGGGIEVDGNGTLLATESSILCRYRNDDMPKATIEMHLRRLLGVSKIIWFPGRRDHDITDCHVDGEVKFLAPGLVVLSKPHKRAEKVEKEIYKEIRDILTHETDAQGRKFKIVEMEGPDLEKVGWSDEDYRYEEAYEEGFDEEDEEDEDVAGTYVNFYFVNGGLILPAFGDKRQDRRAVETLREWIEPERKIRQVYTSALPRMGGVVHCVTQQVV